MVEDFIGQWNFNYWIEENMSNILTIFPDGEACSECTTYDYEIKGNSIHLFVKDYVDYWGTLSDGVISGTAESYCNDWKWSATRYTAPVVKAIPMHRLFDSRWVIRNDSDELEDNRIEFGKDGSLKSSLYGTGSWKFDEKDLLIETAKSFVKYRIKEVDGNIVADAWNKVGQEWKIFPLISRIPKPAPKTVQPVRSLLKEHAGEYMAYLREHGIECLYHFTDKRNIEKIKESGGLYSWQYLEEHSMMIPKSGGDQLSRTLDQKYGLQDYVRLSFCRHHPMLYRLKNDGADIVILKVALDPVMLTDTMFSDMNATDKLHSHGGLLEDLKKVRLECTRLDYAEGMDKKYKQAEVMVKTFLPIKYIININEF